MLRITRSVENHSSVTLKLEGRIVSQWVAVLEQECLLLRQKKQNVVLDFSSVTFIDSQGIEMLKQLLSQKIKIINCPAFILETLNHE
jgi:anti-anti-sigma regulatory factor